MLDFFYVINIGCSLLATICSVLHAVYYGAEQVFLY